MIEFVELVVEVIDALTVPSHDGDKHDEHIARIEAFLLASPDGGPREALLLARKVLASWAVRDPILLAFHRPQDADEAVSVLRQALPRWPYYLYHGTASKHLPSIAQRGLVPSHSRTMWRNRVEESHLTSGVFLTPYWRAAHGWAFAASHTLAGTPRKDTSAAVVRLLAHNVEAVPDLRARQKDCLVAPGTLDTANADVLVGDARGFPEWMQLRDAVERQGASSPPKRRSRNAS